jgi:hypothetical protein
MPIRPALKQQLPGVIKIPIFGTLKVLCGQADFQADSAAYEARLLPCAVASLLNNHFNVCEGRQRNGHLQALRLATQDRVQVERHHLIVPPELNGLKRDK